MKKFPINIERKACSYEILIGCGILERLGLFLAGSNSPGRQIVVTDCRVASLYGDEVLEIMRNLGLRFDLVSFPEGEQAKTMATAVELMDRILGLEIDRDTRIIALGGGVVGDVAGFVASLLLRGLPYLQVPTTLLAQVDSGIGGKTAVDVPAGKNLLGTFHQPEGVFIDLRFLSTLSHGEYAGGLAEIVKYGLIEGGEFFLLLEERAEDILSRREDLMMGIIENCCRSKASLVEMDEHDRGVRRLLNLGHTIGHALEAESGYTLRHGEAVALGIRAELAISRRLSHLTREEQNRINGLLAALGLPQGLPEGISVEGTMKRLSRDKKREGGDVSVVLLKKIGMPFIARGIPETIIKEALEELRQ